MRAWVIDQKSEIRTGASPLRLIDAPIPVPKASQVLLRVLCCGICHTEIDEIEGRTAPPAYPVIPGHQAIGLIQNAQRNGCFSDGMRVGVAWLYAACGHCEYCIAGMENLCEQFTATGRDVNGGYAEYMVANEEYVYPIPASYSDEEAAPLLCAGAIGYRSLRLSGIRNGNSLGLVGFGSSAHLVLRMVRYSYPDTPVFVFARDKSEQAFARALGAVWSGDIGDTPGSLLNAIIDTTPVWKPTITALSVLKPGGRLVINAIAKEESDKDELLRITFRDHIWKEKEIKSVANITREDVTRFLGLASAAGIRPDVERYPFEKANEALIDLKLKKIQGSKVLLCS